MKILRCSNGYFPIRRSLSNPLDEKVYYENAGINDYPTNSKSNSATITTQCNDGQWDSLSVLCVKPETVSPSVKPGILLKLIRQLFSGPGIMGIIIAVIIGIVAIISVLVSWRLYFKHRAKQNTVDHESRMDYVAKLSALTTTGGSGDSQESNQPSTIVSQNAKGGKRLLACENNGSDGQQEREKVAKHNNMSVDSFHYHKNNKSVAGAASLVSPTVSQVSPLVDYSNNRGLRDENKRKMKIIKERNGNVDDDDEDGNEDEDNDNEGYFGDVDDESSKSFLTSNDGDYHIHNVNHYNNRRCNNHTYDYDQDNDDDYEDYADYDSHDDYIDYSSPQQEHNNKGISKIKNTHKGNRNVNGSRSRVGSKRERSVSKKHIQ